jgi:hypothetical protein
MSVDKSRNIYELPIDPHAEPTPGRLPEAPGILFRRPTVREVQALSALDPGHPEGVEEMGRIAQGCVRRYVGDWNLYECGPPGVKDLLDVLTVEDFGNFVTTLAKVARPTGAEGN